MSKALILRALPFGADSRALRWARIYCARDILWGTWGSQSDEYKKFNILNFRPRANFLIFIVCYPIFMIKCFFYAFKNLRPGDVLVCIDLETVVFSFFAAKMRGARIHFDIADPFYLTKPVPLKNFWRWLESAYASFSDVVTVPHISRLTLYSKKFINALTVENVPILPVQSCEQVFLKRNNGKSTIVIGYFGTIEKDRGIEDIIDLVIKNPSAYLIIAGRGALIDYVISKINICDRIRFVGEYKIDELPNLTKDVDVYCSLYYSSKFLHKYAAPNKFFEHLVLAKPVLISACTPYAVDVVENGTGWVVEDGLENLQAWFNEWHLNKSAFEVASNQSRLVWRNKYAAWLENQQKIFR